MIGVTATKDGATVSRIYYDLSSAVPWARFMEQTGYVVTYHYPDDDEQEGDSR